MKTCPTCHRTFAEEHLKFCTEDGTPLGTVETHVDEVSADEITQVRSSFRPEGIDPAAPSESSNTDYEASGAPYQPPGSYLPPGSADQKRRTWPWLVGVTAIVVLAIAGFGIAATMLFRNIRNNASQSANAERRNISGPILNERNSNTNTNSTNSNANVNDNSDRGDSTPPPTNQDKVLADLKKLEDEWTVANVTADKKKLDHILADDYVGVDQGRAQGKAQYLKTLEPDPSIQHWEFENLKVSLSGDRVSLSGVLRLEVKDENGQVGQVLVRFTDKFVWRDGRWQATSSVVEPVPVKPGTSV